MYRQLKLGSLLLKNPVIYAPLAGCSDFPFREIASHYSPGLQFCEMVKMQPLVRNIPATMRMLDYSETMRPIGAQICGSALHLAKESAKIIEDAGFDVLDLNCGCPVDKVTKDGSGSGLLKNPQLIGDILNEMVQAVKIPVTLKIRIGWDDTAINCEEITEIAQEAKASAITVHGRTRKQAYKGPSRWEFIKKCKERATSIKVIGNGDLFSVEDVLKMLEMTQCDGVCISRGTFGQPWITQDIEKALKGKKVERRNFDEIKRSLLKHFEKSKAYKDVRGALIDMRRVSCWYLKNIPHAKKFRGQLAKITSLDECKQLIESISEIGE